MAVPGRNVDTIYLPRRTYNNWTQFGGVNDAATPTGAQEDANRMGDGPFGTATIVYAESQGFASPTQQDTQARFAGRFIGADGAEMTGTWSLGQPAEGDAANPRSNDLDVIHGSYGVTRQANGGPGDTTMLDGTAGGAAKTVVFSAGADDDTKPTIAGDADAAGILRLGKASTGGGKDANNDFDLQSIFAQPGADPKKTVSNSGTHVQTVVSHIEQQRAIYVIYSEQVGGDSDDRNDLANRGRQDAWKSINDFVLQHIFDNSLTLADTDASDGLVATEEEDLSTPLGSYMYPTTRNGRPDDGEALKRIDALLTAFENAFAFEDANKDNSGGVFDSTLAEGEGRDNDPFPLDTLASDADGYSAEPFADIFNRLVSQTQLFSLSTDYTRFGVWFRRETSSAVAAWTNHGTPLVDRNDPPTPTDASDDDNAGAESPGSYAYSWLSASSYRRDRT